MTPTEPDDQQPPPLPKPKPKSLDDALSGMRPKADTTAKRDDEFEVIEHNETPKRAKRSRPRDDDERDDDRRPTRVSRPRESRPAPKSNTLKILLIVGGVVGLMFLACAGIGGFTYYIVKDEMDKQKNFRTPIPTTPNTKPKSMADWQQPFVKHVDETIGLSIDLPPKYVPVTSTVRGNLKTYTVQGLEGIEGPMTYRVEWFDATKREDYDLKLWCTFGLASDAKNTFPPTQFQLNGAGMLWGKYEDGNPQRKAEVYVMRYNRDDVSRYFRFSTVVSGTEPDFVGFISTKKSEDFFNSIKLTIPKETPENVDPRPEPTTEPKRPGFLPTGPSPAPKMPKKDAAAPPAETTTPPANVFRDFLMKPKFAIEPYTSMLELDGDEILTLSSGLSSGGQVEVKAIVYESKTYKTLRNYRLGGGIEDVTEVAFNPTAKRLYVTTSSVALPLGGKDKFLAPGQVAAFASDDFRKPASADPIRPTATTKFAGHVRALGADPDGKTVFAAVVTQGKKDDKSWKTRFVRLKPDTLEVEDDLNYDAAILAATLSPDGKTIAVVEHQVNPFGYVSYGTRSEGVVHFVDAKAWTNTGQAQTRAALSQAVFLDDKTIVALSEGSNVQQLLRITTAGETTAYPSTKNAIPIGLLAYDRKTKRMIGVRHSRPGMSVVEDVSVDGKPKVFAYGVVSPKGPIAGLATFLANGKRFAIPNGGIYEFED